VEREKATHAEDLPHRYVPGGGHCLLCGHDVLDARHLAWEKASTHPAEEAWFPDRELGT
jgi:hypothetical protein